MLANSTARYNNQKVNQFGVVLMIPPTVLTVEMLILPFYYMALLNAWLWLINHGLLRSVLSLWQTVAMNNRPLWGALFWTQLILGLWRFTSCHTVSINGKISGVCVSIMCVCHLFTVFVFNALIKVTVSGTFAGLGSWFFRHHASIKMCFESDDGPISKLIFSYTEA